MLPFYLTEYLRLDSVFLPSFFFAISQMYRVLLGYSFFFFFTWCSKQVLENCFNLEGPFSLLFFWKFHLIEDHDWPICFCSFSFSFQVNWIVSFSELYLIESDRRCFLRRTGRGFVGKRERERERKKKNEFVFHLFFCFVSDSVLSR